MKNKCIYCAALLLISLFLASGSTAADNGTVSKDKYLNIATTDNEPISVDRLLYHSFKSINCDVTFTCPAVREGYESANDGTRDGVIAAFPDLEETYPDLRRIPVALEQIDVCVFAREGTDINVTGWDNLDGLNVGVLSNKTYIFDRLPESVTISTKETSKSVLDGLARGEYDVAVLIKRTNETLSRRSDIVCVGQLDMLTEYLYVNKSHEELIPSLTEALTSMFADGRANQILYDIPIMETDRKKTIVHIISTNTELTREDQFSAALRSRFENDMDVEWHTVSLNSRRLSRDPNRLSSIASLLRQDCMARNVAAVIVSGDEALDFLLNYYYLYFRNAPVLFYGVGNNYQAIIQGYEEYFTGITENLEAYETVRAALALFPETKNIYVVNDYTAEGRRYRSIVEEQLKLLGDDVNIEYNENVDCESLLAHIKELPKNSLLFVGSYFVGSDGQYYPLNEMKRFLERDCNIPVFSFYSTDAEYNSVGGKCLDYAKYGEVIADMLQSLLEGANPGDISVISDSTKYNSWVFNKTMMDKFGISERDLPHGAQIINKIPSIWESNPRFVVALLLLFTVSIVAVAGISALVINIRHHKIQRISDEKVREVKERLERIINTAPISYMLAIDGKVVEINEKMRSDTGLDIGDETRKTNAVQGHRRKVVEQVARENIIINEIMDIKMANGEVHRAIANIVAVEYEQKTANVVWAIDVEQSERQKDELQNARQKLQTILDMMPAAVRVVDNNTKIVTYANKKAAEMFGVASLEDAIGKHSLGFLSETQPNGRKSAEIIENSFATTAPATSEVTLRKANGELFDSLITSVLIDYNGVESSLGIIQDLTAEKEYQRMLANTAEKEREANSLKSRFLVNMSHEIRTPINAIIGLTEIELHSRFPGDPKEIYKKIYISAKSLLTIINDILDLSKIEADKIELYEEEFELEEVLTSALLVVTPRLNGKNVELMFDGALDLPRYIVGDKTRLWQILKNLLDNSAKFTDYGKIILTVFTDCSHSDDALVTINFIIKDTGLGMDNEQIEKIFLPYQQVYNEVQKKYMGTGLGMPISKQLCELMGGTLKIESELGKGTETHIGIPFRRSPNNKTELKSVMSPFLSGIKILIVDDDRIALDVMEGLLKNSNADCATAQSGTEAMEIILEHRDRGEAFDVIVLDYMMEDLNGLETANQIRLVLSKVPELLMVTAYQKLLIKEELEKSGIGGVIEKPFTPSHFIGKLCSILGFESYAGEEQPEAYMKFSGVKALLCEDLCMNQDVAVGMLAQFGILTDIAENGSEGIEFLNSGESYDLIFMDLHMPVMDGYEATRAIRAEPRFDDIPIIGLTADAMKDAVRDCLRIGMNDHLAKPVEYDSLYKMLLKWIPECKRVVPEYEIPKPAVDPLNEALARFGNDEERYNDALLEFSRMLPDKWQDFGCATNDVEKTKNFIHKLKSEAGTLSEKEIYKYAVGFESSLYDGTPDENLYNRLVSICSDAKIRIIEQAKALTSALTEGTYAELTELLTALKAGLNEYDPETIEPVVNSIKGKTWPSVDRRKLNQLYTFTKKFEYNAAIGVVDDINNSLKIF